MKSETNCEVGGYSVLRSKLTAREAAAILGVTSRQVRRLRQRGDYSLDKPLTREEFEQLNATVETRLELKELHKKKHGLEEIKRKKRLKELQAA